MTPTRMAVGRRAVARATALVGCDSAVRRVGGAAVFVVVTKLAALTAVFGCASGEPATAADTTPPPPTLIAFQLPDGVHVQFAKTTEMEAIPLAPKSVEPGSHEVAMTYGCKSVRTRVEAIAGQTVTIDLASVPELASATFVPKAKSLAGAPLKVNVFVNDARAGTVEYGERVLVPACATRISIAAVGETLGRFQEDLDFTKQPLVEREVVLAPGPDMVRLPGGPFTFGPPLEVLATWKKEAKLSAERGDDEYWLDAIDDLDTFTSRRKATVAAFDIDRTEVTAGQFLACRVAGSDPATGEVKICFDDASCSQQVGCYRDARDYDWPDEYAAPYCNVPRISADQVTPRGREDHPANCVSRVQAEAYCRWAGKRLPTHEEMEYAQRSGDDTYEHAWGTADLSCKRSSFGKNVGGPSCDTNDGFTEPVCSRPAGNSSQGVCDLFSNVHEYVVASRKDASLTWMQAWYVESGTETGATNILGFRCVRDAEGAK